MLYGWKENSMFTNCLAACAHLTITLSEIYSEIFVKKNRHFIIPPLHSTPLLGGFPSEYRHPLWCGKIRMVSLPEGEKIDNSVLAKPLAACAHLSSTVSQLFEPQVQKYRRFHVLQHTFLFPLGTPLGQSR